MMRSTCPFRSRWRRISNTTGTNRGTWCMCATRASNSSTIAWLHSSREPRRRTSRRLASNRDQGSVVRDRSCFEPLAVDQRRAAVGVVVLFPALANVSVRLVEADGARILRVNMQPDRARILFPCGLFNATEQFTANSATAHRGQDFNGLNVGHDFLVFPPAVGDCKASHEA